MSYNIKGDFKSDFFEENPELLLIKEMKEFKENNKDASKILWCLYYSESPQSNFYRIKNIEERRKQIDHTYYQMDWNKYNDIKEVLIDITLTDTQKSYKILRDKSQELEKHIKTVQINNGAIKGLEEAFKTYTSLKIILTNLEKELKAEENKTIKRGGGEQSSRQKRIQNNQ